MLNKELFGLQAAYTKETLFLDPDTHKEFLLLQEKARVSQIEIKVASGFRSFERQLSIWNAKAMGKRKLLDSNSKEINPKELTPKELIFAILRWSALPGFSRHHWGSDFDIIDANALGPEDSFELIPSEYQIGGVFERLGQWLNQYLDSPFYRPYELDHGGVAPEPWHISYRPISEKRMKELSFEEGLEFLKSNHCKDLAYSDTVIDNFKEIYERFVIPTA